MKPLPLLLQTSAAPKHLQLRLAALTEKSNQKAYFHLRPRHVFKTHPLQIETLYLLFCILCQQHKECCVISKTVNTQTKQKFCLFVFFFATNNQCNVINTTNGSLRFKGFMFAI